MVYEILECGVMGETEKAREMYSDDMIDLVSSRSGIRRGKTSYRPIVIAGPEHVDGEEAVKVFVGVFRDRKYDVTPLEVPIDIYMDGSLKSYVCKNALGKNLTDPSLMNQPIEVYMSL